MKYDTIRWRDSALELLDQSAVPGKLRYIRCKRAKDVFQSIRSMKIRGAPAIGVAAAYGVYLGLRKSRAKKYEAFRKEADKISAYMAGARPTARNLFWALERMMRLVDRSSGKKVEDIKKIILREAHGILREDRRTCVLIGRNGAGLIKRNSRILTHCNAGALATAGNGTALSVVFASKRKIRRVYADETRPVLQGARLTVWELVSRGIPATLICDNMAASIMVKGHVDCVIVGADRIASNGDTANKIGTYNLAVLAKYHRIPFYVAAPVSTFDLSLKNGRDIPIEERSHDEVRKIGNKYITVRDVDVENPAFDVTPAGLISAMITEKGVIRKPDKGRISRVLKRP